MAYINGNKPIVTNGLVYALDFGNTKSYNSGSNRAVSLAYDPVITSVTQSVPTQTSFIPLPQVGNGTLEFNFGGVTSTFTAGVAQPNIPPPQYIQRTSSLSAIDINNDFTITTVVQPKTPGTFISQQTSTTNFYIKLTTTSSLVGYYYNNRFYNREFKGITTSSLQHLTYRYSSGSIDMFINGIPVTASSQDSITTNWHGSGSLFINGISGYPVPYAIDYNPTKYRIVTDHPYSYISGSLGNLYVYNRKLTSDEIYQNYIISATRYGLRTTPKPYTLDENVYQYVQSTGITDSNTQTALSTFVSGLKLNKIWDKMLAIYPFLSSTTASHSYNLKEPGLNRLQYSGSWTGSLSGSYPGTSTSFVSLPSILPTTMYPGFESGSAHLTYLSYDLPQSSSYLVGTTNFASGSGGLITFSGSRTIHTFTASDSFSMLTPGNVEVLVVAAGGASGYLGGGGAGGVLYSTSLFVSSGSYTITVGTGSITSSGQNSVFSSLTAIGGGKGGQTTYQSGFDGGSGGGAGLQAGGGGSNIYSGGSGSSGQGNIGSAYINENASYTGGAGGGAGTPGGRNIPPSGQASVPNGGDGLQYSISGTPTYYGGGGGGAQAYSAFSSGRGGIGGGGSGSSGAAQGGQPNTGGGSGGTLDPIPSGSAGGSGIVIISYPTVATSSFALKITETSLTGSLNSPESSAITASGNIGLVTVSRKQAGILSLHKNNISASFGTAGEFLPFPNLYLNAANNAGTASGITPSTISYASIGAGLTTSEVATYHNLVSQLQANLKRQNTLLDNYSGSAAAYSLRRIGPSSYFGPAIRVRRDSDNTLRDIGFTSDGQLDTVGLLDFVGVTGSGFVQTWYDQSGNGYNATEANAKQPLVLLSGSVLTNAGKPCLQFDNTDDSLKTTLTINRPYSIFAQFLQFSTLDTRMINSNSGLNSLISSARTNNTVYTSNNVVAPGYASASQNVVVSLIETVGTSNFYYNTNNITNGTANADWGILCFGAGSTWVEPANGQIKETIVWLSDQTSNNTAIQTNINNYYKIYGSATASFDPDYSAFITATGITQPTQSAALETLVSDLKSYGLWNKMKAIYPMITDKNNRFAYSQALATTWNAVNVYVTQSFITAPDGTLTGNFVSESAATDSHYIYQTIADGLTTGSEYVASIHARFLNRPWIAMETNTGAKAWFNIQTGITGSLTGSNATITSVGSGWYRCALYFTSSVASGPQNIQYNLADANGNLSYAGVAGTGSYLWGAQFENGNVLGPYRATTATGFTTGSMLDQMKFNLKNPVDTDAGFRLTYSGSWNPGYYGVQGNGSNTFAKTNINFSSSLQQNNTHVSMYFGKNIQETAYQYQFGNYDGIGPGYTLLSAFRGSGQTYYGVNSTEVYAGNLTKSNGLIIVNRTTTGSMSLRQNTNLISTSNTFSTTPASTSFILGSLDSSAGSSTSTKDFSITTIGDGLTDYETKALYWIVQKYQTTLGRQVY